MILLANRMCTYDGQYFHFASGRNYIVSLLSYSVPEWRNGRRRGFKIPRLHGRVSSSLTLGTIIAIKDFHKLQKLKVFFEINFLRIFLIGIYSLLHYFSWLKKIHCYCYSIIGRLSSTGRNKRLVLVRQSFFFLPKFLRFYK